MTLNNCLTLSSSLCGLTFKSFSSTNSPYSLYTIWTVTRDITSLIELRRLVFFLLRVCEAGSSGSGIAAVVSSWASCLLGRSSGSTISISGFVLPHDVRRLDTGVDVVVFGVGGADGSCTSKVLSRSGIVRFWLVNERIGREVPSILDG